MNFLFKITTFKDKTQTWQDGHGPLQYNKFPTNLLTYCKLPTNYYKLPTNYYKLPTNYYKMPTNLLTYCNFPTVLTD